MPIVVNKEEKRRNIACSCENILLEYGIKNLTISQIAKSAGVGKGTIYEYFDNKEDIVFEIITIFVAEYKKRLLDLVSENISTKDKLFHFFYMIHANEESQKHLMIYREFLAVSMMNGTQKMIDFNIVCRNVFLNILGQILDIGIEQNEIQKEVQNMKSALLTFSLGLVVDTHTAALNPKNEISTFLDTFFYLIELKEKK